MRVEEYQQLKMELGEGGAVADAAMARLLAEMEPGLAGVFNTVARFYGPIEGASITTHEALHQLVNQVLGADTNIVGALILEGSFHVKPQPFNIYEMNEANQKIAERLHDFIDKRMGGRSVVR